MKKENPNNSQTEKPQKPKKSNYHSNKLWFLTSLKRKKKYPFIIYSLTMSGGPVPVWKKYTTRPQGIWEKIRQLLVLCQIDHLVILWYRCLDKSHLVKESKKHRITRTLLPYQQEISKVIHTSRDYRRNYPQVHTFNQTKISGLLNLGSESNPRISIGEKGNKELAVFTNGQDVSLASTLCA